MMDRYWGFDSTPFRSPTKAGFFNSAASEEATARFEFLIENRYRLGILVGEQGSGKTTLLRNFRAKQRAANSNTVYLSLIGITRQEFVEQLNAEFGLPDSASTATIWQNIHDTIRINGYQNIPTVLLLDDLHEATEDVRTSIVRLARSVNESDLRFTIILASGTESAAEVDSRFLEMATLKTELWPWTADETSSFIQNEIQRCGRDQPAFEVRALDRIYSLSNGNPRRICLLAELALAAAAGQLLEFVNAETVDSIVDELSTYSFAA